MKSSGKTPRDAPEESPQNIPWDDIFASLSTWKDRLDRGLQSPPEPAALPLADSPVIREETLSVQVIAEEYRANPAMSEGAWAVLVSTILSLRTKDAVTIAASRRVLDRAPTPERLLAIPEEELAALAYPAGFYRTKAKNLRNIAAILIATYGGEVPGEMDALLALPGVGRKTANLTLSEAFGIDAICVDTHVHRISNRMGWCGPQGSPNPDSTEMILRTILPRKYWRPINRLLVLYGQEVCKPISPICSQCVVGARCPRQGVGKSR